MPAPGAKTGHFVLAYVRSSELKDVFANQEQEKTTGLAAISTALRFAATNKEKKLLIAGHTDLSGGDDINFEISQERAESVLYIIENNRDKWASLCEKRHTIYDIQHILTWAGYAPGPIDGVKGQKTTSAIKAFQRDAGLKDDGVVGTKTFGAIFDRYQQSLSFIMKDDIGKAALDRRMSLNWAYADTKAVGCGELFPKKELDEGVLKNQINRRVETLFFDADAVPPKVCKSGGCTKESCKIFRKGLFKRIYIDPENIASDEYQIWLQDRRHNRLADCPYLLKIGDKSVRGFSSKHLPGLVKLKLMTKAKEAEIFWGIQNTKGPFDDKIDVASIEEDEFLYRTKLTFVTSDSTSEAEKCLDNLGYTKDHPLNERVYRFQVDYSDFFRALSEEKPEYAAYRFKIGAPWPDEATKKAVFYVNKNGTETTEQYPEPSKKIDAVALSDETDTDDDWDSESDKS
jgi:hypothetical protein